MSVGKRNTKWLARISVNRRRIQIGLFATEEDARSAYGEALAVYASVRTRKPKPSMDPRERFFSKTRAGPNGCLLWTAALDKNGYGKFQLNGGGRQTHVRAHRYAFFLAHGRWPKELALHSCDTPGCVNADHLEDGNQGKNVRDCVARGRNVPGRVGRRKRVAV